MQDVFIPIFYNPGLFWIIDACDIPKRQRVTANINKYSNFEELQSFAMGQLVIVKWDDLWFRAELIKVSADNAPQKKFICWLYDYGIFRVIHEDIFLLPQMLQYYPTYVKKAMLYGIIPAIHELDIDTGRIKTERVTSWAMGICKNINKRISESGRSQKFSRLYEHNGYEIGHLFHVHNGEEQNVAQQIVKCGLAEYNEDMFRINLFKKRPKATIETMYEVFLSITSSDIKHNVQARTPIRQGRATFRFSALFTPGEGESCKALLADEFFVDAELKEEVSSSETRIKKYSSGTEQTNDNKTRNHDEVLEKLRGLEIPPVFQHAHQVCIQAADEPEKNTINEKQNVLTPHVSIAEGTIAQCSQDNEIRHYSSMAKETFSSNTTKRGMSKRVQLIMQNTKPIALPRGIQPDVGQSKQNTINDNKNVNVLTLHDNPEGMIEGSSKDKEYRKDSKLVNKTFDSDTNEQSNTKPKTPSVLETLRHLGIPTRLQQIHQVRTPTVEDPEQNTINSTEVENIEHNEYPENMIEQCNQNNEKH